METKKLERENLLAADVVLLIIKNEGELVDDIEYPSEFINAYAMLQAFNIIKTDNGKFVPAKNFDTALRIGVQAFVERELLKAEKAKLRNKQTKKLGIAAFTTAAVAAAGYFYKKRRS